jgi:hypothetical protein
MLTWNSSVRGVDLSEIYSENVAAKIIQVAQRGLKQKVNLVGLSHLTKSSWRPGTFGFIPTHCASAWF